jgi:hypothetical protein
MIGRRLYAVRATQCCFHDPSKTKAASLSCKRRIRLTAGNDPSQHVCLAEESLHRRAVNDDLQGDQRAQYAIRP